MGPLANDNFSAGPYPSEGGVSDEMFCIFFSVLVFQNVVMSKHRSASSCTQNDTTFVGRQPMMMMTMGSTKISFRTAMLMLMKSLLMINVVKVLQGMEHPRYHQVRLNSMLTKTV